MALNPGIVCVPAWKHHRWLRAGFSTRTGGDTSVYGLPGEQNLGWTLEDDGVIVAENRRHLVTEVAKQLDGRQGAAVELVTLRQVHGAALHVVTRDGSPLSTPDGRAVLQGDGALTRVSNLLLGVQTADCVPVLVADTRSRAVAAFHAGWRGTLARIVEHGVGRMRDEFGSRPEDLIAAIGPAIRPCCFAVGDEVRAGFAGEFGYAAELFHTAGGQLYADLHEANRWQLLDAGLAADAVTVIAKCTACARLPDGRRAYFSHRAEQGRTGRMLSVIGSVEA